MSLTDEQKEQWDVIKPYLASLTRFLLVLLAGYLITKDVPVLNIIASWLQSEGAAGIVIAFATAIISLSWSFWRNRHTKKVVDTARLAPMTLTSMELKQAVKSGQLPVSQETRNTGTI